MRWRVLSDFALFAAAFLTDGANALKSVLARPAGSSTAVAHNTMHNNAATGFFLPVPLRTSVCRVQRRGAGLFYQPEEHRNAN